MVRAALDASEADDGVAVMVIKGAGRAFSSGADISGGHNESAWITSEDGMAMNKRYRREFTSMWMDHIWDNAKPVIAQGPRLLPRHGGRPGQRVRISSSLPTMRRSGSPKAVSAAF